MNDIIKKVIEEEVDQDDFFFSKHGVGDKPLPVEEEFNSIRNSLNPEEPTGQEIDFCRRIIKGENKTEAYIAAFRYEGDELKRDSFSSNARRLLTRPRVAKELHKLRKKAQALAGEDIASLVAELNEDRKLARDLGQPAAAIGAVKAKAAILGINEPKSAIENTTINLQISKDRQNELLSRLGNKILNKTSPPIEAEYEVIDDNEI